MNGVLIMRERERERVRGSESEWTTVIRGRRRQREGERKREDPKTNYAYNKPGQSQRYYHENWRDKDSHSFINLFILEAIMLVHQAIAMR